MLLDTTCTLILIRKHVIGAYYIHGAPSLLNKNYFNFYQKYYVGIFGTTLFPQQMLYGSASTYQAPPAEYFLMAACAHLSFLPLEFFNGLYQSFIIHIFLLATPFPYPLRSTLTWSKKVGKGTEALFKLYNDLSSLKRIFSAWTTIITTATSNLS